MEYVSEHKNDKNLKMSRISEKYTSTGRHSGYQVDFYHSGLDKHKSLSALEYNILLGKIHNQTISWNAEWQKELQKN